MLAFWSCSGNHANTMKEEELIKDRLAYLALGDSYTIGESVDVGERWPVQLGEKLSEVGRGVAEPRIIAKTGWTTDELISAIGQEDITETYDMVSLLIGVNNQYRGYAFEQYQTEFAELLSLAISFAGQDTSKVFVVSIPDYGVTPFAANSDTVRIANEIDRYNQHAEAYCEALGVQYVDITEISRQAREKPDLVANDGLHPSAAMYRLWVERIVGRLKLEE